MTSRRSAIQKAAAPAPTPKPKRGRRSTAKLADTPAKSNGTDAGDHDAVLSELKKLREGRGLTADRLAQSPAVMDALGLDDPATAHQAVLLLIANLGDGERVRALKVDLGVDLADLFGRQPRSRERDWLTERRDVYSIISGRSVKTLTRWSDKTLSELRAQFIPQPFRGHVLVTAGVQSGRLAGIDVITFDKDDEGFSHGQTTTITNPSKLPSTPLLIYGIPYGWEPASLTMIVMFLDDLPEQVWAVAADSLANLSFGHQRFELTLDGNITRCRFETPGRELVYGVAWGAGCHAGSANNE